MHVGTKTLKNRLSHYLRRVRAGETVTVTDRGVPVAEMRPVGTAQNREADALRRLAETGAVTVGNSKFEKFKPVRLKGALRLSDAVLEDRE